MSLYDKTIQWGTIFETSSRFTQGDNGTGTAAVAFGVSGVNVTKGNQATGAAYIYNNQSFNNYSVWDRNPEWFVNMATQGTAGESWEAYVSLNLMGTTGAVDPNNYLHVGFRISCVTGTRTLYATSGDGVTAVQTSIALTSGTLDDNNTFYVKMTSGEKIDFLVNGSLLASHTTNLPSGDAGNVFAATIKGSAGTSSDLLQIKQAALEFGV